MNSPAELTSPELATAIARRREVVREVEQQVPGSAERLLEAVRQLQECRDRCTPGARGPRFRGWTLEELRARPRPRVLVPDAISGDDLIAATGDWTFWRDFTTALGDGVVLLRDQDDSLRSRVALVQQADALRRGLAASAKPAVVIYCERHTDNWDWFAGEASVVADAESPILARVIRLRDHDGRNKVLRLREGSVILASTYPDP